MEKQELPKTKLDFVAKSVKFHIDELVAEADRYHICSFLKFGLKGTKNKNTNH